MRAIEKNITKYGSVQAFAVILVAFAVLFGSLISSPFLNRNTGLLISMNASTAIEFICLVSIFLFFNSRLHFKVEHFFLTVLMAWKATTTSGMIISLDISEVKEAKNK